MKLAPDVRENFVLLIGESLVTQSRQTKNAQAQVLVP